MELSMISLIHVDPSTPKVPLLVSQCTSQVEPNASRGPSDLMLDSVYFFAAMSGWIQYAAKSSGIRQV